MLAALPHDVLLVVVEQLVRSRAAEYGDDAVALRAYTALARRTDGPSGLINRTTTREQYLNLSLQAPLHVQSEMHRCLEHAGEVAGAARRSEQTVKDLEDYVLGASAASMRVVATVSARSGDGLIEVEATARARDPADPRAQWRDRGLLIGHGVSGAGEPFALVRNARARKNHVEYWKAGRAAATRAFERVHDALAYIGVRAGRYSTEPPAADWDARWAAGMRAYHDDVRQRALRVRTRLTVATDRALELWDQSLQQVVRATPPVVTAPMTCLVLRSTTER